MAKVVLVLVVVSFLCYGCGVVVCGDEELEWYKDSGLRGDADALLQFKEGVQDPKGVLRSWNYLQTPCSWRGVECGLVGLDGRRGRRVVGLEVTESEVRGPISGKLGELSELEVLILSGNELEGVIPEELGECKRLVLLDLDRNNLVGSIPVGLVSHLVEFSAAGNQLSGELDSLIGSRFAPENGVCESLKRLDLSRNRITGEVPKKLSLCEGLVEIRLGSNYLVGGIPREFGVLWKLERLDLENNILDRPLPEELSRCSKLRRLNVADNFIEGEIPASYGEELRELAEFDVARNRLSGQIPHASRWRAANAYKILVNDVLSRGAEIVRRRFSFSQTGTQGRLRRSLLSSTSRSRRSAGARWGLGIAVGLVTGAVAATLLALLTRVTMACFATQDDLNKPIIFNKKITANMLAFLDKDEAFAGCRLLGEGGNGKVYQVPLQDDLVVAIKRVRNPSHDPDNDDPKFETFDAKQIRAELETLGFIRHRNLVQLLAYVFKADSHFLVYEFMVGGSLQDVLNQMAAGTLTLSWPERHRILCGVVQGLAYLHNESLGSSIVHRDLKPANILLGEGYEAKLGDFGLAAIVPLKATHASTNVIAGTIGFIAPEYHQTMRYSQRSDVFSFGVVIAQLVTARSPTDQFVGENGGSIGQWLHKCLQTSNGAMEAIDPTLQGSGYEGEIVLAMKVAVFCTNLDPQQRPKSSEVLQMLLQIRNPDPVRNLSADSTDSCVGSDAPIIHSSGPLKFPGSDSSTTMSSSY